MNPGEQVWVRSDSYNDECPVAVYGQNGFIKRRFMSEEDAAAWAIKEGFTIATGLPPGLRADLYTQLSPQAADKEV